MITSDNILLTSGVILTVLISAFLVSYTSKYIFLPEKIKKSSNPMYIPDEALNHSSICILSSNAYSTEFDKSPCFNKTLAQWYNPWLYHHLWMGFWNEIKARNRLKTKTVEIKPVNITETQTPNKTEPIPNVPEEKVKADVKDVKEKPIEFVYSILVGLLVVSGLVACWEVCKDKLKQNEGQAAKGQEPQCYLADFTINRHLRRESQQQTASHLSRQASFESTAKVTQNLIHQSSLDRAFPKTISEGQALECRRNSVPSYSTNDIQQLAVRTKGKLHKRQSVDVPGEDIKVDLRKKSRHFIRRH